MLGRVRKDFEAIDRLHELDINAIETTRSVHSMSSREELWKTDEVQGQRNIPNVHVGASNHACRHDLLGCHEVAVHQYRSISLTILIRSSICSLVRNGPNCGLANCATSD